MRNNFIEANIFSQKVDTKAEIVIYRTNLIAKMVFSPFAFKSIGSPKRVKVLLDKNEQAILIGKNLKGKNFFDIVYCTEFSIFNRNLIGFLIDSMKLPPDQNKWHFSNLLFIEENNSKILKIKY